MVNKYKKEAEEAQRTRKKHQACDRKVAYPSKEAAFQKGQRTYKCHYCGMWHRSGSLAKLVAYLKRRQQ